ncbi:MAG: PEP-CTERM sorting domain-containing protein [Acidobacteria bacterium]|nr:PEP-CTERM sorting domain-containing protein [Acidobacteriota bacterium]
MRRIVAILGLVLAASASVLASPVLTITNPDIIAAPGGTASWNFSLTNDADYLVVTTAGFEDLTPIGTFTDEISSDFNPVDPGDTWTGVFGSYAIDAGTALGASSSGRFMIFYDVYGDPEDPSTGKSFGNELWTSGSGSITASAVPEPASMALVITGIAGLLFVKRLRRSA